MNLRYLIVDDEPIAHRVIQKYCADLPFLQLEANCYDALQAMKILRERPIDLIFLDINMPKLKGFDFLRTLERAPQVIVTSAYQEYALEGFELNVCDYLLKPFSFERFLRAVNKAIDTAPGDSVRPAAAPVDSVRRTIFIKSDKTYHQVQLEDINYIEASGNYSKVVLVRGEIKTPEKISDLEQLLDAERFLRVHKSFIVAIRKIEEIEGNQIRLGKATVPIGRNYKMNVDKLLK